MVTYKNDLDTPALIVDIDKLKFNISDMADFAAANNIRLRPHAKTHKTPEIGKLQLEAGAAGLTLAKLSEAEVFIDAGCHEILVAYPLVGPIKHRRLAALCERANITTVVDHADIAEALSRSMTAHGIELSVMVEVDTGLLRCGVAPGEPARDLAHPDRAAAGFAFCRLVDPRRACPNGRRAGSSAGCRINSRGDDGGNSRAGPQIRAGCADYLGGFDRHRQSHGDG